MILTTITPYWNRPEMLAKWLAAIKGASHPEVVHLLMVVGDDVLPPLLPNVLTVRFQKDKPHQYPLSIGHYHNAGAVLANSEWIMKLDVDALPNARYFKALLPVLAKAKPREWFNGGMFYVNKTTSETRFTNGLPIDLYHYIVDRLLVSTGECQGKLPCATNFICRRHEYLELGGCKEEFRGWGWEDYQQIYMLRAYELGLDPLPGNLTFGNVTQRCRTKSPVPRPANCTAETGDWLSFTTGIPRRLTPFTETASSPKTTAKSYSITSMNNEDVYMARMVRAGKPISQIALKLSLTEKQVTDRLDSLVRESQSFQTSGYAAFCEKWVTMCAQYQLLGESLKAVGLALQCTVSETEIKELLDHGGIPNLCKNVMVFPRYEASPVQVPPVFEPPNSTSPE